MTLSTVSTNCTKHPCYRSCQLMYRYRKSHNLGYISITSVTRLLDCDCRTYRKFVHVNPKSIRSPSWSQEWCPSKGWYELFPLTLCLFSDGKLSLALQVEFAARSICVHGTLWIPERRQETRNIIKMGDSKFSLWLFFLVSVDVTEFRWCCA